MLIKPAQIQIGHNRQPSMANALFVHCISRTRLQRFLLHLSRISKGLSCKQKILLHPTINAQHSNQMHTRTRLSPFIGLIFKYMVQHNSRQKQWKQQSLAISSQIKVSFSTINQHSEIKNWSYVRMRLYKFINIILKCYP